MNVEWGVNANKIKSAKNISKSFFKIIHNFFYKKVATAKISEKYLFENIFLK